MRLSRFEAQSTADGHVIRRSPLVQLPLPAWPPRTTEFQSRRVNITIKAPRRLARETSGDCARGRARACTLSPDVLFAIRLAAPTDPRHHAAACKIHSRARSKHCHVCVDFFLDVSYIFFKYFLMSSIKCARCDIWRHLLRILILRYNVRLPKEQRKIKICMLYFVSVFFVRLYLSLLIFVSKKRLIVRYASLF